MPRRHGKRALAAGKVSGTVGEASHAASADEAANALNATRAATADALAGGAVVSGGQVIGELSNATIAGGSVSGAVADASRAATADAARGVVPTAKDSDITPPAAGQFHFNATSKVFQQYDGSGWKTFDAGQAELSNLK